MKTAVFSAFAALAALFLILVCKRRWWDHETQRHSDPITIGVAILILLASTMMAAARPSPYPPVTQFEGDRHSARQAQMGVDVPREAQRRRRARYLYPTRKRPPVSRQKWRAGPTPAGRPVTSNAYRVDAPISFGEGVRREARRAVGRPAAWCGWWLGQHLGMLDRRLWLARNWASVGSSAGGPRIGAVVVWRHHVGIITGRHGNQWVVKSGNDGRRVRERPRSVAGAIAFRTPHGGNS